jgi:hypothetical protein
VSDVGFDGQDDAPAVDLLQVTFGILCIGSVEKHRSHWAIEPGYGMGVSSPDRFTLLSLCRYPPVARVRGTAGRVPPNASTRSSARSSAYPIGLRPPQWPRFGCSYSPFVLPDVISL